MCNPTSLKGSGNRLVSLVFMAMLKQIPRLGSSAIRPLCLIPVKKSKSGLLCHFGVQRASVKGFRAYGSSKMQNQAVSTRILEADSKTPTPSNDSWKIKMLYDGECPLCMREVNMLLERNKSYHAIKFVDISADDYSPQDNAGIDYEAAMGRIHAISSDGNIFTNVEAFKKLYEAVGLGWVYAITNYEPFATIAGAVYSVWAKYRLPITGRPPLVEVLQNKKNRTQDSAACNKPQENID